MWISIAAIVVPALITLLSYLMQPKAAPPARNEGTERGNPNYQPVPFTPSPTPARGLQYASAGDAIRSTVRVEATLKDGSIRSGTGWVIEAQEPGKRSDAAVVVTAGNIVAGAIKVAVVPSGSADTRLTSSVFKVSADRDVAFMEVKDLDAPALKISDYAPYPGNDVTASGYANRADANETSGVAKTASIKRGGLSKAFRGPLGPKATTPVNVIEYDAAVLPGFAGGPVLDTSGCVVGLTISEGRRGTGSMSTAPGMATAIAGNEIAEAAAESSVSLTRCDGAAAGTGDNTAPGLTALPGPCRSMTSNFDSAGAPCVQSSIGNMAQKLRSPVGILAIVVMFGALVLLIVSISALRLISRLRPDQAGSSEGYSPTD